MATRHELLVLAAFTQTSRARYNSGVVSIRTQQPPMQKPTRFVAVILLCAAIWPNTAAAQERTPLPEFNGQSLIVADAARDFSKLQPFLSETNRDSQRTYYVVVVGRSGPDASSTQGYLDELKVKWRGAAGEPRFDTKQSVIILLATENRSLSMTFGDELKSQYRLQGDRVSELFVQPHFIPQARAGDYVAGLRDLVVATEDWINQRAGQTGSQTTSDQTSSSTTGSSTKNKAAQTDTAPRSVVPVLLAFAAAAVLIIAVIVVLVLLRQKRQLRLVREEYEAFRQQCVEILDKVDQLKERHRLLPFSDEDYVELMQGETLDFYNRFDESLGQLRDHWLDLMRARDDIGLILDSAGVFRPGAAKQAQAALAQVQLEPTKAAYEQCQAQLDHLESAHETARESQETAVDHLAQLEELQQQLTQRGIDAHPYIERCNNDAQQVDLAKSQTTVDPLGASQILKDVMVRVDAALEQMKAAVRVLDSLDQLQSQTHQLEGRIGELRETGLRLDEPGSNPDEHLRQCEQAAVRSKLALRAVDLSRAREDLMTAEQAFKTASHDVVQTCDAREFCQAEVPRLREVQTQLLPKIEEAHKTNQQMLDSFAINTWQQTREHADRAQRLFNEGVTTLDNAEAASSTESQQYLAAQRHLQEVGRSFVTINQLTLELEQRYRDLNELAADCQERVVSLKQFLQDWETWLTEHEVSVGRSARDEARHGRESLRHADELAAAQQVDWPAIHQQLELAFHSLNKAQANGEEDVRCHREFESKLDQVDANAKQVGHLLDAHTEDRLRTNRRYEQARQELDSLLAEISGRDVSWPDALRRLMQLDCDFNKVETWAREDIRLARRAERELRAAEREVDDAAGFLRYGVSPDVNSARRRLEDARRQFANQAYEQVIELANRAEREARQAKMEAQHQAERRRQQAELERQRRQHQRSAGQSSVAPQSNATSRPRRSPPAASKPPVSKPPRSDTSQDSWQSDSSLDSW